MSPPSWKRQLVCCGQKCCWRRIGSHERLRSPRLQQQLDLQNAEQNSSPARKPPRKSKDSVVFLSFSTQGGLPRVAGSLLFTGSLDGTRIPVVVPLTTSSQCACVPGGGRCVSPVHASTIIEWQCFLLHHTTPKISLPMT